MKDCVKILKSNVYAWLDP